ncbi:MAG TPA: hypothetical protein DEP63_04770 [Candidatus Magasanikbacteria bacterium]|uniref:Sigma-70 region 2 domain protein n=1 Tax=Candidatus Magasanikbacteria bacterium GW2011_GWE2_42_7 TaxID=1619052 RepID=A0A0G1EFB9_9BACT|nr:MAG: Sigma-70 region 2 domain protein [Candidatus Magasanikbacteria bacterium GW2011_GWE2_42_7]HBB38217.1 hypothetical protein [Candidatus Magasanikbacteria bacterium]HCC14030.1 hypothetical protein [Candidatus Magasanikbacteria bacterium]HCM53659.1 hypothetical protein [Candidatus Magasanikbacteria bacterium]
MLLSHDSIVYYSRSIQKDIFFPMNNTHIQRWADAASHGDREAFGRLYDLYIKEIYRFVYYKTHHTQTAEDLTADIFVKAIKNISSYVHTHGSFRTWLYTITRSAVIDHYRTQKHDSPIEDAWDIVPTKDTTQQIHARIEIDQLKPYLAQLSSEQRDILVLRLWQAKSYKEIADILGKSEASCKMAFSRSLKTLRDNMPLHLFLMFLTTPFL